MYHAGADWRGRNAISPFAARAPQVQLGRCRTILRVSYTHVIGKRLQVLVPDQEMSEIQRMAKRERLTIGEWVRRTLREARSQRPVMEPEAN